MSQREIKFNKLQSSRFFYSSKTHTYEIYFDNLKNRHKILLFSITIGTQATAASLNDDFWFKKYGFNAMLGEEDTMFLNMTVYDYLWYYRSSIVHRVQSIAPFLVPTNNSGCLYQVCNFEVLCVLNEVEQRKRRWNEMGLGQ